VISRMTLRMRMILLFCVVVGIFTAGIYVAVYSTFVAGVQKTRYDRMVNRALPLILLLQYPNGAETIEKFDLRAQSFEVYDAHGHALYKSKNLGEQNLPAMPLNDHSQTVFATLPSEIGEIREAAIPIEFKGQPAWFIMAERTTSIDSIEEGFRKKFILLGTLNVLLTALLATWYVARSLKPIVLLTSEAEQLTHRISPAGGYAPSPKLPVRNPFDEVGRLATTFNVLFDRVDSVVQQLQLFVSDAAHELRTPLAILHGETQLVLSQPRTTAEYKNALITIDSELATMGRIIEGLFTLSMADAGQLNLEWDTVYLDEILEESCGIAAPLTREKAITIAKPDWHELPLHGDQTMLRRLFLILIENAIKYSPRKTTIHVDLVTVFDRPTVVIRDEGIGIAPEDLPHIFKRFYRAAPQPNDDARSGGLGLSIAEAIITAHQGTINCESTLGVGSTFTMTFPPTE
jgi:signal transduction histidine kinase